MKYNLSRVMKRAWEIKNKLNNNFSEALKMSWKIEKFERTLREEYRRNEEHDKVEFNIWTGYGKVRAYYTCNWRSNYQNNYKKTNFISLVA